MFFNCVPTKIKSIYLYFFEITKKFNISFPIHFPLSFFETAIKSIIIEFELPFNNDIKPITLLLLFVARLNRHPLCQENNY